MAVSDDFNRANNATLGANWTDSISGMGIESNEAAALANNPAIASYSAVTWNPAHTSQITCGLVTGNGGPAARVQGGGAYFLYLRSSTFVRLYFYNGSFNFLNDYGIVPTIGRTYKIEVASTTIKFYENGVQLGLDYIDGSLSDGAPGVFGDSTDPLSVDDWVGTGEVSSVVAPLPFRTTIGGFTIRARR